MFGRIILIFILLQSWFYPYVAEAAMSSTNYYIYADSIDTGGGLVTSTSFDLQGTAGESPSGATTSTTYIIRGGYQSMEVGTLSMSISAPSLSLGELSPSQVKAASTVVTITSDSTTGYTLSFASVAGTSITGVADGAVTAGSEEYGVAVAGVDAVFSDDKAVTANHAIASSNSVVVDRQATLTFKGSINSDSRPAGSYNQTVTLLAATNL